MMRPFQARYLGYWLIFGLLVLASSLKLATPLLAVLFSYFVLNQLNFFGKKILGACLFVLLVAGILYGFGYFIRQAVVALPNIAEDSLERFVEYAKQHKIPLPEAIAESTETGTTREETINWVKESVRAQAGQLGNFAKIATKEFAFLL